MADSLHRITLLACFVVAFFAGAAGGDDVTKRRRSDPPVIRSTWDDLLEGIKSREDWEPRGQVLKQRYLKLIRDDQKPMRPPLDLQVHETKVVDGIYKRLYISYNVEADERAHAYLGIPLSIHGKAPAVVALHGTYPSSNPLKQEAGLDPEPLQKTYDNAYVDHLCRRGFVVVAPEHFVSGERTPPEGTYDTTRFYQKHPDWPAVGKFTFEHSIAIDVLQSLPEVDAANIGAMGHSLGGEGTYFLAAYDDRVKASVCNCGGTTFRHYREADKWARERWYVYLKHLRPALLAGELPPIDIHEIIALIAPRAYLDVSGLNDGDPLTQRQRVLMLLKVADVYELIGAPQNFAFFTQGRGHSVPYESRELIYGFLEAHLKPADATRSRRVPE